MWAGTWKDRTTVAVKILTSNNLSCEEFLQEAEILKKLRHTNFIQVCQLIPDIHSLGLRYQLILWIINLGQCELVYRIYIFIEN